MPVVGSHVLVVHGGGLTGVPVHVPETHWSLMVHELASEHAVPFATAAYEQVPAVHVPVWQGSRSPQLVGVQVPPLASAPLSAPLSTPASTAEPQRTSTLSSRRFRSFPAPPGERHKSLSYVTRISCVPALGVNSKTLST
jgi:hypothetical protein